MRLRPSCLSALLFLSSAAIGANASVVLYDLDPATLAREHDELVATLVDVLAKADFVEVMPPPARPRCRGTRGCGTRCSGSASGAG